MKTAYCVITTFITVLAFAGCSLHESKPGSVPETYAATSAIPNNQSTLTEDAGGLSIDSSGTVSITKGLIVGNPTEKSGMITLNGKTIQSLPQLLIQSFQCETPHRNSKSTLKNGYNSCGSNFGENYFCALSQAGSYNNGHRDEWPVWSNCQLNGPGSGGHWSLFTQVFCHSDGEYCFAHCTANCFRIY